MATKHETKLHNNLSYDFASCCRFAFSSFVLFLNVLLWARLAGSLAVSWLKSNGWIFVRICSKKDVLSSVLSNVWRRRLRQYEPQEFLLENFVCCYSALSHTHTVPLSIRLPTNLFAVLDITLNVRPSIQLYESRILNCLRFYANSFFFSFLSLIRRENTYK